MVSLPQSTALLRRPPVAHMHQSEQIAVLLLLIFTFDGQKAAFIATQTEISPLCSRLARLAQPDIVQRNVRTL